MPGLERWEEIRPRLEGYWNHEVVDRCCVSITAPRAGAPGKAGGFAPQTDEEWQKWYMDGEILLNRWRAQNEHTVYLGDAPALRFSQLRHRGPDPICARQQMQIFQGHGLV